MEGISFGKQNVMPRTQWCIDKIFLITLNNQHVPEFESTDI